MVQTLYPGRGVGQQQVLARTLQYNLTVPVLDLPPCTRLQSDADAFAYGAVRPVVAQVLVRVDHEHGADKQTQGRIDLSIFRIPRGGYFDVVVPQARCDEIGQCTGKIPFIFRESGLDDDGMVRGEVLRVDARVRGLQVFLEAEAQDADSLPVGRNHTKYIVSFGRIDPGGLANESRVDRIDIFTRVTTRSEPFQDRAPYRIVLEPMALLQDDGAVDGQPEIHHGRVGMTVEELLGLRHDCRGKSGRRWLENYRAGKTHLGLVAHLVEADRSRPKTRCAPRRISCSCQ